MVRENNSYLFCLESVIVIVFVLCFVFVLCVFLNRGWKFCAAQVDAERKVLLQTLTRSPFDFAEERLQSQDDKSVQIFESAHNYPDLSNYTFAVECADAEAVEIAFSSQSSTEANFDYIQFLKKEDGSSDDGSSPYYGLEKYTGGYNNSNKVFPGVGSTQVLVIPASKFWVRFISDGMIPFLLVDCFFCFVFCKV